MGPGHAHHIQCTSLEGSAGRAKIHYPAGMDYRHADLTTDFLQLINMRRGRCAHWWNRTADSQLAAHDRAIDDIEIIGHSAFGIAHINI